ncbi:MAG TPA: AlkA N-terminal domain-containing protein [Solirubrobacteraceae bacterium]
MDAEFEARYRAISSRDRRFDGHFVVAVTSTGIYCRPSCPAITPRRSNVRFYPTAAAAQDAGFRSCLRCHPHAAPGSPQWRFATDLAARAIALIADGVVDREGVTGLAQRLAYSERHLHRQLVAELGAGPLSLARAQRSQTARMLIETSELPMIEVAHAAGFASVRQFNDTIKALYGRTPTELRRRANGQRRNGAKHGQAVGEQAAAGKHEQAASEQADIVKHEQAAAAKQEQAVTVKLHYREPFDWDRLLGFLALRAVPGIEEVQDRTYRRTLRLPHGDGVAEIGPGDGGGHLRCRLHLADLRDLTAAVQRCRRLLDLDADPAAVDAQLASDPLLAPLIAARPGLRLPGTVDGHELAIRAVLGQQVSVAAARTTAGRLTLLLGESLPAPVGSLTHLFPTAAAIATVKIEDLHGPMRRRRTLQALAAALQDGEPPIADVLRGDSELTLDPGSDRAAARARLLALPGIGAWTTEYIAMRALGDPDAFPVEDLGVMRSLESLGGPTGKAAILAHAERWRPWRAYAVQHLWAAH